MQKIAQDAEYFLNFQTQTGWGRVLSRFRDWANPQHGWLTLDVGCGPGLMPALLAQRDCYSFGIDIDLLMFLPTPLHQQVAAADVMHLPFPDQIFDLITASNLLFLLPDPLAALGAMRRLLCPGGHIAILNPSERLTVAAATKFIEARNLTGLARETLLNWAARSEAHFHWTEVESADLFAAAEIEWIETHTIMGPGFARLVRGIRV